MEKQWRCLVCGYVHRGENPPEVCPVCGAGKEMFELISGEEADAEDGPKSDAKTEERIKEALFRVSYGLYIITARAGGKDNGQCANTCFQITSEPARLAIGINKRNYTHELIEQSGKFGVSVLHQSGQEYARRFGYSSGRERDKFAGLKEVHRGKSGILLLDDCLATMEASVRGSLDAGTHTLYLADVTGAEILKAGEPMTYAYFRATKNQASSNQK